MQSGAQQAVIAETPARQLSPCTSAALVLLNAALGPPEERGHSLRWYHQRASGAEVRLELHPETQKVWIFDAAGRGLRGAYSFEVDSEAGVAWLRDELRRLRSEPQAHA